MRAIRAVFLGIAVVTFAAQAWAGSTNRSPLPQYYAADTMVGTRVMAPSMAEPTSGLPSSELMAKGGGDELAQEPSSQSTDSERTGKPIDEQPPAAPLTLLTTPSQAIEPTLYPAALFPWALFFFYLALLMVAVFQHSYLATMAEKLGRQRLRKTTDWRLIWLFAATLLCIAVMQFGYAAYSTSSFFRSLTGISSLPWLVLTFGFLPLPVLLIECLCVVRHPKLGCTRHYRNNIRLHNGLLEMFVGYLEAVIGRSADFNPVWREAVRFGLRLCRFFLVYGVATFLTLHIQANTSRRFWKEPFRTTGQFIIDCYVFFVAWIMLLGVLFAVSGLDPEQGMPVGPWNVNAALLIKAYVVVLVGGYALVMWNMISDPTEEPSRAGGRGLRRTLLFAIGLVFIALGLDVLLPNPALLKALFAQIVGPDGGPLAGPNRFMRAYAGGWAPVPIGVAIIVLAGYYLHAVGRIWQELGIGIGNKIPFFFMMKARHRAANLISPVKVAIDEAGKTLALLAAAGADVQFAQSQIRHGEAGVTRLYDWLDEMRRGGESGLKAMGATSPERSRAILADVLEAVETETLAFAKLCQVSINFQLHAPDSPSRWTLAVDQTTLHDALSNLTHNACEAIQQQAGRDTGRVSISACASEDRLFSLELVVEDDGPGIPASLRAKIFEPWFSQGKSAGTGIGLYNVKSMMNDVGGEVTVDNWGLSHDGRRGARFRLLFPVGVAVKDPMQEKLGVK